MNNKTIFQFSVYWKDRAQTENVDKKSIQFKSALRGSLNPRLIKVLLSKVEAGSECTFLVWTVWQPDGTDSRQATAGMQRTLSEGKIWENYLDC